MILTNLYNTLFNYKSFQDTDIEKGNVVDIIDNITLSAKSNAVKNYIEFIEFLNNNDLPNEQEKRLIKVFKQLGIKKSTNIKLGTIEIKDFLLEVLSALQDIKPIAIDALPDTIDISVMSAREMGIIGTITIFSAIVFALEDLSLYFLYVIEDAKKFMFPIKNKEFIKDLIMLKSNYKELRGKCAAKVKILRKLDGELEVKDSDSFGQHADGLNKRFTIGTNGFLGSPIFIMRKAWEDFKIERIEAMKDKKSLFELKLTNLKHKNDGSGKDLKIENAIEYYEERITKYEREIKAFEEDI